MTIGPLRSRVFRELRRATPLALALALIGVRSAGAQCDAAGSWVRSPATKVGTNANLLLDGRILYSQGTPQLYDTTTGVWSPAPAMNQPVSGMTTTLLQDGRVLAVGEDSAELYDPVTNSWDYTRDLSNPDPATNRTRPRYRRDHTATLLRDGRVLLVGGRDPTAMTQAQAFDPRSGKFVGNWNLSGARSHHSATLLEDGKVLIVGGAICAFNGADYSTNGPTGCRTSRDNRPLDSTQIFDPVTSRWSAGPPITTARYRHTATRLVNGDVVIAGGLQQGHVGGSEIESAQLFDVDCLGPGNPCWRAEIPLDGGRHGHTATLLPSGRLLVAGGSLAWTSEPVQSAEVYDGSAFALVCDEPGITAGRVNGTVLPDGRVFFAGGNNAQHYQEKTYSTVDAAPMADRRSSHTATLLADGRVLISGGHAWGGTPGPPIGTSQVYVPDPTGGPGCWEPPAPMLEARTGQSVFQLPDGRVLAAGGYDGTQQASVEIYDPGPTGDCSTTGSWSSYPENLRVERDGGRVVTLADGRILIIGGWGLAPSLTATNSVEIFDPDDGSFTEVAPMAAARANFGAVRLDDLSVLVAGGAGHGAEVYDPFTDTWTATTTEMWVSRTAPIALLPDRSADARNLQRGRVVAPLGAGHDANAEIFDPASGEWRLASDGLTEGMAQGFRIVHLPDGAVAAMGGHGKKGALAVFADVSVIEPIHERWSRPLDLSTTRTEASATTLLDGRVLVAGGVKCFSGCDGITWGDPYVLHDGAELWSVALMSPDLARRPEIVTAPMTIRHGQTVELHGRRFRGDSEGVGGGGGAVNYPLIELVPLGGSQPTYVAYDAFPPIPGDPTELQTLTVSSLPADLVPGRHRLRVIVAGIPSEPVVVTMECGAQLASQPQDATVDLGEQATFAVAGPGLRRFRWEKNIGTGGWTPIAGAVGPSLTTPPAEPADAGSRYRVTAKSACASREVGCSAPSCFVSDEATLNVVDDCPPGCSCGSGPMTCGGVELLAPRGGEYWLLSPEDCGDDVGQTPCNTEEVVWEMADDIRVCVVDVRLQHFDDAAMAYVDSSPLGCGDGGLDACGLPATFSAPGSPACFAPGELTKSLTYTVPSLPYPPSGRVGSRYRIALDVTDYGGNPSGTVTSEDFYLVEPNLDAVDTLILSNTARMQAVQGITPAERADLDGRLQELADHPQVVGAVVDLDAVTDLRDLYGCWDGGAIDANEVLFGAAAGRCGAQAKAGIQTYLAEELDPVYTGVAHLVIVGDDRIIPFARVRDDTSVQLAEDAYTLGNDLTPDGSTVGRALASRAYLSDDPLAQRFAVEVNDLSTHILFPDRNVGRLVETPAEITRTIATFISQAGLIDLTALDPDTGHIVQVVGYDFLSDTARLIRERWKAFLGSPTDPLVPVDGELIEGNWGIASGPAARADELLAHLAGNGGEPYAILSLNGHANHYQEGVPGADPHDIQGLDAGRLDGLPLAGAVAYSIGCHSGLPVPGSDPSSPDNALDLPQVMLGNGAAAYVANTGFGWGLLEGPPGYSERLVQLMTEELTQGGTVLVGDAVRRAKQQYFGQSPRLDAFDKKTMMQWTLYGLPMVAIRVGNPRFVETPGLWRGVARHPEDWDEGPLTESLGAVVATSSLGRIDPGTDGPLPPFLTQLNLSFDLSAAGVYRKFKADGTEIGLGDPCDVTAPVEDGCYYTLNGLIERSSGQADLPAEPYLVFDSRLAGTSQHGVLWMGGTFEEELGWVPVFAELASNGGDFSEHGPIGGALYTGAIGGALYTGAIDRRGRPGEDPDVCTGADLDLTSLIASTGEAVVDQATLTWATHHLFRRIDTEVLYFNNTVSGDGNCDRAGPELTPGLGDHYHRLNADGSLEWAVQADDLDGAVWRVVVVHRDGVVAGGGGEWLPVELADDGTGTWRGSIDATALDRVLYVVQAVDTRGNVSVVDYLVEPGDEPASAVEYEMPDVKVADLDVPIVGPTGCVQVTDSCAAGGPGAGNGNADPMEVVRFDLTLENVGRGDAIDVRGAVRVTGGTLLSGGSIGGAPPLDIAAAASHVHTIDVRVTAGCGDDVTIDVVSLTADGDATLFASAPAACGASIPVAPGCLGCACTPAVPTGGTDNALRVTESVDGLLRFDWAASTVSPARFTLFETLSKSEVEETPTGIGDEATIAVTTQTAIELADVSPPRPVVYYEVLPTDSCDLPTYP